MEGVAAIPADVTLPLRLEPNKSRRTELVETKRKTAMPSRHDRMGLRKPVLAAGLAAVVLAMAQPVRAEVRVSGKADAVIVQARSASVDDILAALRASFNLQYRASGRLNRVITGTYTGSLHSVLARLLDGHNYAMQSSARGGELIVFGTGAAGSMAPAFAPPAKVVAVQPEPLEPAGPSGVEGWSGTAAAASPRVPAAPVAQSATQAASEPAPSPVSVPDSPATNSATGPAKSAVAPAPELPHAEPVLLTPQPGIEGWNG